MKNKDVRDVATKICDVMDDFLEVLEKKEQELLERLDPDFSSKLDNEELD